MINDIHIIYNSNTFYDLICCGRFHGGCVWYNFRSLCCKQNQNCFPVKKKRYYICYQKYAKGISYIVAKTNTKPAGETELQALLFHRGVAKLSVPLLHLRHFSKTD